MAFMCGARRRSTKWTKSPTPTGRAAQRQLYTRTYNLLTWQGGQPQVCQAASDGPGDATKMTRTWHLPWNAGGYTSGSNDSDNLDPEILLTDPEKLTILALGRMPPSILWPPVVWKINQSLLQLSLLSGRRCTKLSSLKYLLPRFSLLIHILWIFNALVKCHVLHVASNVHPLWAQTCFAPWPSSKTVRSPGAKSISGSSLHFSTAFQCLA